MIVINISTVSEPITKFFRTMPTHICRQSEHNSSYRSVLHAELVLDPAHKSTTGHCRTRPFGRRRAD